jgi:hypothetical protein
MSAARARPPRSPAGHDLLARVSTAAAIADWLFPASTVMALAGLALAL